MLPPNHGTIRVKCLAQGHKKCRRNLAPRWLEPTPGSHSCIHSLMLYPFGHASLGCISKCYLASSDSFCLIASLIRHKTALYAAVNGHLELTLLKLRQRFDAISTSNLEVYKFRDWWILTYFIFGLGESSPNNIWSMVNLEWTFVLLFYYFLCLKWILIYKKQISLVNLHPTLFSRGWILTQLFWERGELMVNPDLTILLKRWSNRGEDLRWVGSRCPLMHALTVIEECFSKTYSVHFNPFWDNHVFVFIAIYEKFFDYILLLNC